MLFHIKPTHKKNKSKIWQSVLAGKWLITYTKKGEGEDRCFLFSLNCFQPSFLCAFVNKKKSISISIMYSNLPQRRESHRKFLSVIRYLDFCSMNLIYFDAENLHFLKMNYSDTHFSALQSWTATLRPPWASSHSPRAELVGCEDTSQSSTVIQHQFIHKWGLAPKQLSLTLLWGLTRMVGKQADSRNPFTSPVCSGFQS